MAHGAAWLATVWAAVMLTALLSVRPAVAHFGFPRAESVHVDPGNPDHIVVLSGVWGAFVTSDRGAHWSYLCAEAWKGQSSTWQRRSLVVVPGGDSLVAASFDGLRRGGPDACEWSAVAAFDGEYVQDVTASVADASRLLVLTATGSASGIAVEVWESSDAGASWSQLGVTLPADFSGASVRAAPSQPSRLYVAGKLTAAASAGGGGVYRSNDDGATWELKKLPVTLADGWTPRLLGVHPRDPDTVLVWVDQAEAAGQIAPDEVWATHDGGSTWVQVFVGAGDLPGFAFSPDGQRVLISGPKDGIHGAAWDALATDAGVGFERVHAGATYGLAWTGDALYVGGDDFAAEVQFTLGVSTDGGRTIEPLMTVCEPELIACAADAGAEALCVSKWEGAGMFVQDFRDGPRCGGADAGADGGLGGAATAQRGGACACALPSTGSTQGVVAGGALLAAALAGLLRRRRAP